MRSLQLVQAIAGMMKEYVATPAVKQADQEAFDELLMDSDSVVDNLSTAYEAQRSGSGQYPNPDDLDDAFEGCVLAKKP